MRTKRKAKLFWVLLVIMVIPILSACSSNKIKTINGDYVVRDFYRINAGDRILYVDLERVDGKDLTAYELEDMVSSGAFLTRENGNIKFEIPRYLRESKFTLVFTDHFEMEFDCNVPVKKGDIFILSWPGNEPIKLKLNQKY